MSKTKTAKRAGDTIFQQIKTPNQLHQRLLHEPIRMYRRGSDTCIELSYENDAYVFRRYEDLDLRCTVSMKNLFQMLLWMAFTSYEREQEEKIRDQTH